MMFKIMKENNKCYKVYKHINKINGKCYIGITSLEPNKRFGKNGIYYKECTYFWNAIQKYGWDNFEHIIIADNLTKEQACEYEVNLIEHMKSERPDDCYNILVGGDLGRKGVPITEEYREKFRGEKNPFAKSVICIETNRVFDTVTEACKFYHVDRSNIARACRTGMACGKDGDIKLHWAYYNKEDKTFNVTKIRTRNKRVYCETTGLYFNSLKEASEYYNVPYDGIWHSCKYHNATSYGYVWRYADDEEHEFRQAI